MEIKIPDDKMKEIVGGAILKEIGENQRDMLISQAISYLLTKQENTGYYNNKSNIPLVTAFNHALEKVVKEVAEDFIKNDPQIRASIQDLLVKAANQKLKKNIDDISYVMTEAMCRAFRRDD